MKIMICVPCMDMTTVTFTQSLATLRKVGETQIIFKTGSLIYSSRNQLAADAIKAGVDYVVWFDADMSFQPDTLERLIQRLEEGCDIISGLYFRRLAPFTPVLFKWLNIDSVLNRWQGYDDYPEDSLFELQGIGFGCCAMKAEVLMDLIATEKQPFTPLEGFGEDLSFCIRARKHGYKIWCDSTIKCGHTGHITITEEYYKAFREEKAKEEK